MEPPENRGDPVAFFHPRFVQAIGVMAFAYVCHHNSFLIYSSLQNTSERRYEKTLHVRAVLMLVLVRALPLLSQTLFTLTAPFHLSPITHAHMHTRAYSCVDWRSHAAACRFAIVNYSSVTIASILSVILGVGGAYAFGDATKGAQCTGRNCLLLLPFFLSFFYSLLAAFFSLLLLLLLLLSRIMRPR